MWPDIAWGCLAFLVLFCVDMLWAQYTEAVVAKRAHQAAFFSVVLYLMSGAAVIGYTNRPWLLAPAAIGGYLGTWYAVICAKHAEDQEG